MVRLHRSVGQPAGSLPGSVPLALGMQTVQLRPIRTAESSPTRLSNTHLRVWLRPAEFKHRNGADSSGLACVLGKAWVAPRLRGVDAVAFSTGQFADGHLVCLGSAFDGAVTGGRQVVVPVGVGGCSCLGCEDVDDVRLGVVREVHRRGDELPCAFAAAVMYEDHRSALEVPANPALVRSELRDGRRVPVEPVGHAELLSFTVPAYALGRGDGRYDAGRPRGRG